LDCTKARGKGTRVVVAAAGRRGEVRGESRGGRKRKKKRSKEKKYNSNNKKTQGRVYLRIVQLAGDKEKYSSFRILNRRVKKARRGR
jgi:hypothetical protein